MNPERNNITVSVVIPVYNASKTINRCLSSVYGQTYKDYEVIIVNDGSTDSSQKLIEDLMESSSIPVKLINQENKGVSVARNIGIQEARGKYIAFLDSDDEWEKEKLEIQMKVIESFPEIALLGTASNEVLIMGTGKGLCQVSVFRTLFRCYFNTSAVLAKKEALLEAGLFPLSMSHSEDLYLWVKIAGVQPAFYLDWNLAQRQEGRRGLSNQLVKMEKGQLYVIRNAHKEGFINGVQYMFLLVFSLLKFGVRIVSNKS